MIFGKPSFETKQKKIKMFHDTTFVAIGKKCQTGKKQKIDRKPFYFFLKTIIIFHTVTFGRKVPKSIFR